MSIQTNVSDVPFAERWVRPVWQYSVQWLRHRRNLVRDRREVRRLFDLNPALLDDMGLERQDIAWVLQCPSDCLPSHRLHALRARRSHERLRRARKVRR